MKNVILQGDASAKLKELPDKSINMCMTSPPYWALRDYGVEGQLGLEFTIKEFINNLCNVFDEVKRVLKDDGTCWVNLGDTYAGANSGSRWNTGHQTIPGSGGKKKLFELSKQSNTKKFEKSLARKSLCMIPERFAIEMLNRGWILRNKIIWHKPNIMPSSAKDRFTTDFEYLFFFSKKGSYYFEQQFEPQLESSVNRMSYDFGGRPGEAYPNDKRESPFPKQWNPNPRGRNKRAVWKISTRPMKEAHFATYPEELCETPISAGCPEGGIVIDPFFGSGTTGLVARKQKKNYIGIELNQEYIKIAEKRLQDVNK